MIITLGFACIGKSMDHYFKFEFFVSSLLAWICCHENQVVTQFENIHSIYI